MTTWTACVPVHLLCSTWNKSRSENLQVLFHVEQGSTPAQIELFPKWNFRYWRQAKHARIEGTFPPMTVLTTVSLLD